MQKNDDRSTYRYFCRHSTGQLNEMHSNCDTPQKTKRQMAPIMRIYRNNGDYYDHDYFCILYTYSRGECFSFFYMTS